MEKPGHGVDVASHSVRAHAPFRAWCCGFALAAWAAMGGGPAQAQSLPAARPPSVPSAADKAAALVAVRDGNQLLDAGDPDGALAKFQQAHRLVGGDKLYYNFAQAYRAMPGHAVDAYRAYLTFIERATTASSELQAAARAEQAEVRQKVALMTVNTKPPGATVTMDGEPRGTTPLPGVLVLAPGRHRLRVTRDGYQASDEDITLRAGQSLDKEVGLAAVAIVAPARVSRPEGAASPAPVAQLAAVPSPTIGATSATSSRVDGSSWLAAADPTGREDGGSKTTVVVAREQPATTDSAPTPYYRRWWVWTIAGAIVLGATIGIVVASGRSSSAPVCQTGECTRL